MHSFFHETMHSLFMVFLIFIICIRHYLSDALQDLGITITYVKTMLTNMAYRSMGYNLSRKESLPH